MRLPAFGDATDVFYDRDGAGGRHTPQLVMRLDHGDPLGLIAAHAGGNAVIRFDQQRAAPGRVRRRAERRARPRGPGRGVPRGS